ncbi:protein FLUORESCENT IN BLUE LIGHT, chloroplastic [Sesamum indicum]|uniref:Protein FLUORESCENT IN BLUE LIGHT, chloroplastic n=1 Tax=Sesamum indicum TaxID=4182 RepID=A0A6I9TAC9_SESIN|nr:protein FLUORESCENT IN BLUE LIGHT, chloroplastic [Sesamum indicum]
MTMLMKQGLLTWSPCDPHFISRFSHSYLNPRKSIKPTSSFTIFAARNDPNSSNFICPLRKVSEGGGSQLEMLANFDFKGRMLRRLPATVLIVTNAIVFDKPLEALAETCQADNSVFNMNMPLLLFVALIGATVGGLLARQRRGELQRLNEQLRQINAALRRQAKIESYAPSLSYAPVGGRIAEDEVIVDPRQSDLISRLKNGKNFLRNQEPEKAFSEFKTALELAQNLKDPIEEKKAARGLGASLQRQGKYRDAIKYHSMVLEISQREGEESGNTEAYGAIADCYTELGDLERAAKYYDQYISRLQSD